MFQDAEVIYGTEHETKTGLNSEKVQGMASNVYAEFQRMMSLYGEDVIKELMPLIVTILETLDRSLTECNEQVVEIEMLRDDNEQLANQFERERQLRRSAEQRLMESEDTNEMATREIRDRATALETTTRHLELKCKNYTDQVERLQEREADLKKEFSQLHDRHTEMIQSYMEHIEKTKTLQHQSSYSDVSQSPHQTKKDLTPTTPSAGSPGFQSYPSEVLHNNAPSPITTAPDLTSTPGAERSLASIKDEIPKSLPLSPNSPSSSGNDKTSLPHDMEVMAKSNESGAKLKRGNSKHLVKLAFSNSLHQSVKESKKKIAPEAFQPNASKKTVVQTKDIGSPSGESDGGAGWVSEEVKELLQNGGLDLDRADPDGTDNDDKQTELESTGIENAAFETTQNTNVSSLFAEMSQQDLGDVDEGADIFGMSKEVDNLIQENSKLLATKNALNIVKDDLIQQVDQLNTQHALLKEEIESSEKARHELKERQKELEKQLHNLQQELENVAVGRNSISKQSDEEDVVPLSQRKRFTRVEMARVLMERNQYKERLMELQEAVRWTETLRASKNHPDMGQNKNKSKSSIFQFFSRLFASNSNEGSGNQQQQSSPDQQRPLRRTNASSEYGLNVAYSAPSKIIPRSRSSTASLYGKSPTIDALREAMQRQTPTVSFLTDRSPKKSPGPSLGSQKREVPQRLGDNHRLQACGWSLPNSPATPKEGSRMVPVPVYCGPVHGQEPTMKIWCATAVNIQSGQTRDGGVVVGTSSVFYQNTKGNDESGIDETVEGQSPDVVRLSQELESEARKIRVDSVRRENLSSLVWLVSDDSRSPPSGGRGSVVTVMDAREPGKCIERFAVGKADVHVLCITCAPGAAEDDFATPSPNEEADSLYTSAGDNSMLGLAPSPTELQSGSESAAKLLAQGDGKDPAQGRNSPLPPDVEIGGLEKVQSPTRESGSDAVLGGDDVSYDVMEDSRLASLQPTVWMGAQNGCVYVHSAISNWKKCLHTIRLKDSVLAIVHMGGKALAGLADGTVAIFSRDNDGIWDLSNYYLLDLGRPHHSIRCMTPVYDRVWCGYRNKIHVIEPKSMKVEATFNAHPRRESQVRQLTWAGDGVWVSIRLDSTVRLYHARTHAHLQDVDIEPYVSKVLGSGKLGFSFVRITSLMIANHRLWIGTGNGVVMSVPLSEAPPRKPLAPRTTSSLQRTLCVKKQQFLMDNCQVSKMDCLICKRRIASDLPPSGEVCECHQPHGGTTKHSRGAQRATRLGKKKLFKFKFLSGKGCSKGAKSNFSGPVLSTAIKNTERPGGVVRVYSDPNTDKLTPGTFIPYCSMANAQLSFHGYRDAVKFFVAVPGCVTQPSSMGYSGTPPKCDVTPGSVGTLVMSGGEGYVDFRMGDLGVISPSESRPENSTLQKSHVIVWQLTSS